MAEKYSSRHSGLDIDNGIDLAFSLENSKGEPSGIATLDSEGKLAQMPSAADTNSIPISQKGASNGVPVLDEEKKILLEQIPDLSQLGAYLLIKKQSISNNSDLNNYTNPGVYIYSYIDSPNILNSPIENEDFKLIVHEFSPQEIYYQIIFSSSNIYIRKISLLDSIFSNWSIFKSEDDSGWIIPEVSNVVPYNNLESNKPKYRRKNDFIEIMGTVSPSSNSNNFGSSTQTVIFTLPEEYRPSKEIVTLCQGSVQDFWTLAINTLGEVIVYRYRDYNGYKTPSTATWMPFNVNYLIN